jgi:hypothetical protein
MIEIPGRLDDNADRPARMQDIPASAHDIAQRYDLCADRKN